MDEIHTEMIDYINKSKNIFDIYAFTYKILKMNTNDLQVAMENEYGKDIQWEKDLKELLGKDKDKYKDDLIKLIPYNNDEILVFLKVLLTRIDMFVADNYYTDLNSCIVERDGMRKVELQCLNTDVTYEIGKVFYRNKSFLEEMISADNQFKLEKEIGETIERYQNNLFVKKELYSDTKTNLYNVNDQYILDKLKDKRNYKIAIVPFDCDQDILDIQKIERKDGVHINIKGIKRENEYLDLVSKILKTLSVSDIDIVIFPEMIFTKTMLNLVKQIIKDNRGKFLMIVCGTIWEGRENSCIVLGGNGIELGRQMKLNRYRCDKFDNDEKLIEDILLSTNEKFVNIYDINGFGRFCTPICADFINDDYYTNIADIGVNICFVPTYTTSLFDFEEKAIELGKRNFGSVFLSNFCGITSKNKISFVYLPQKIKANFPLICERRKEKSCKIGCCDCCFVMELSSENKQVNNIKIDIS